MANLQTTYSTSKIDKGQMGQVAYEIIQSATDSRHIFERRWYDNNFFDDGYHFRYVTRTENKVVDLSQGNNIYAPLRSIPKASRQIRGVANLLIAQDPVPVVYPEKVSISQYPSIQDVDPETNQPIEIANPQFLEALDEAKRIAKLSGHFLTEEFKNQDLIEKLALMIILAAKHGVSYMQIWPDAIKETIKTQVYDAFDIYLVGTVTDIYDSPFIAKGTPRLIAEIKADERFDPEAVAQISPENRFASSDIKEAYMRARHGGVPHPERVATLIQKEIFFKEYLDQYNSARIRGQKNGQEILKNKKAGDIVIRQTFVAGNFALKDEYINLPDYPFVDFRFEPGPIYQVPLIERFIPANKSLDMLVSRAERYSHTMVTGSWLKRQGEQMNINNVAGGQVIEYTATPPVQNQIAPIPNFFFQLMGLMTTLIEEQGVSVSTLNKIPTGVRANSAIESLKESEYSNLQIAQKRLKGTVKRIAEKMLDLVDDYFVTPKTVYYLDKGEPNYFDIIGASAIEKRKSVNLETPQDVIPIKQDYRVEIEVQSQLGYTKEGQKASAKELGDYMIQLAQLKLLPPEVVTIFIKTMLEVYQFGPTEDIMEAMQKYQGNNNMTEDQIQQTKIAVLEVMKDLQAQGILPTSEQRIMEGKVATAEALKDTGAVQPPKEEEPEKKPTESISFKDLPPEGKVQMAQQAGISLTPEQVKQQEEEQFKKQQLQVKAKQNNINQNNQQK